MAIVGMIFGITGVLGSTLIMLMFPLFYFVALPIVGIGLPLSWVAFRRARHYSTAPADLAFFALLTNSVALVFILVWSILIALELNSLFAWW